MRIYKNMYIEVSNGESKAFIKIVKVFLYQNKNLTAEQFAVNIGFCYRMYFIMTFYTEILRVKSIHKMTNSDFALSF